MCIDRVKLTFDPCRSDVYDDWGVEKEETSKYNK